MNDMLSRITNAKTRSLSAENPNGEKGKGGMATEGFGANAARDLGRGWKVSPAVWIEPHSTYTAADIKGSGIIRHIWNALGSGGRNAILRMYWDGSDVPSVEVPFGDFFCNPFLPDYAPIVSQMVCVNPRNAFNCYWDMPFRTGAKITIENITDERMYYFYQIDYEECDVPDDLGYLHVQWRRSNPLKYKDVHTILDGVSGKGQYVGTYICWGVNNNNWWGEGEIKFYMDGDTEWPTICGTGTEDYFGGAWNFDNHGYERFCTPYSGMTPFAPDGLYKSQQRFSLYRWHINDPVRFEENLRVTIQALGWRSGGRYLPMQDDIASTAFWYQSVPAASGSELGDKDHMEII